MRAGAHIEPEIRRLWLAFAKTLWNRGLS
jgi:hypothetical protein